MADYMAIKLLFRQKVNYRDSKTTSLAGGGTGYTGLLLRGVKLEQGRCKTFYFIQTF